jgi:DegV family protein with EDD domain
VLVLQALKMAEAGSTMEEILAQVRFMIEHVEHIFTIADLSWMVKGGRINKPLGVVGSVLNIRPWLDVEDGKMVVRGMVRGEKKAISTVAQEVTRRARQFQTQLIAITHAGDAEAAKKIEKLLKEALPACRTVVSQIGGVLGVHLGMGGIGVFFFNERPSEYRL